MDFGKIIIQLRAERNRVDQAIAALEALDTPNTNHHFRNTGKHAGTQSAEYHSSGSRMSLAARKRMSEMMKQRWAERKKKPK